MPFCVVEKHVFIIDLHFGMESITPTSNQFCVNMEDKTLILKVEILLLLRLVRKMMRQSVSTSSRETWESGSLSPEKVLKSLSLECEKMLLCMEGQFVYMIDLHSRMENIMLPSNLCCTNLKAQKCDL